MTPEQVKQLAYGFLAFADDRAGPLQHLSIAAARSHLDGVPAADLFAWLQGRGYLPTSNQEEKK